MRTNALFLHQILSNLTIIHQNSLQNPNAPVYTTHDQVEQYHDQVDYSVF